MSVFAAVHGGVGDPIDVAEADVRATLAEAAADARAAAEATGGTFRVVEITEHAVYPPRARGSR